MGLVIKGTKVAGLVVKGQKVSELVIKGTKVPIAAAPPPPVTESHTFTLNAQTINAAAAGVFTNLNEEFRMGRRLANTNIIADNSEARFLIAADLTIDVGIAGQSSFKSSIMENIAGISAAQYRAFPGRFVGSQYTIKIST